MINPGSATENGVLMAARGDALSIKFWGLSLFSQALLSWYATFYKKLKKSQF